MSTQNNVSRQTVAVAGVGNCGIHVLNELKAQGNHKIVVLSRQPKPELQSENVEVRTVDYNSVQDLVQKLKGVDILLDFIFTSTGLDKIEINITQAAVIAGIKRYAPSEWNMDTFRFPTPFYREKEKYHQWLAKQTLPFPVAHFFTGVFMDYLADDRLTLLTSLQLTPNRQVTLLGDGYTPITFSSYSDIAKYVVAYVNGPIEKWGGRHGIEGERKSWNQVIDEIERIRGVKFERKYVALNAQEVQNDLALDDPKNLSLLIYLWLEAMALGKNLVEPTAKVDYPEIKMTIVRVLLETVTNKSLQ